MSRLIGFAALVLIGILVAVGCAPGTATPAATTQSTPTVQAAVTPPSGSVPPTGNTGTVKAPADLAATAPNDIEYLQAVPMTQLVKVQKGNVDTSNGVNIPVITWGGDVATIYANGNVRTTQSDSIFAKKGLKINLFREDNFVKQVEAVISGRTPYLRGTVGMGGCAAEALEAYGIEMVAIYQMTWSTGGDTLVVRSDVIQKPEDLHGQNIALQRCGPHAEYLGKILADAGLQPTDVNIRWMRELTLPPYDSRKIAVDPLTAMQKDSSLAAATLISPDMLAATAGGKVGIGGESVQGVKMLLDTRTGSKIIADLYWVRRDYYEAHPKEVQDFVHGLMLGAEEVVDLYNARQTRDAEYQTMLRASADILRDSPQATADIDGLLADATFVHHAGNVQFFTGVGTTRTYETLQQEAETVLIGFGLRSRPIAMQKAQWDYRTLAVGLRNASAEIPTPERRFDPVKVEQFATTRQGSGGAAALFSFSIQFEANQSKFPADQYRDAFAQAVEWADTYSGAIIIITGYADTFKYNQDKEALKGLPARLAQVEQSGKNTSLSRAQAVKESMLEFAKAQGVFLDPSQITVVGAGYSNALYSDPKPESETQCTQCAANRRVVFELIPMEAEATQFKVK